VGTAAPLAPAPSAAALAAAGLPAAAISGPPAKIADQSLGSASADSPIAAPGAQSAASPGAGFGLALGLPVDDAGAEGAPSGDNAATAKAVTGVAAPAKGAATAAAAAASTVKAGAAAGTANKPTTVAATAAINAATTGPSGTTDGSTTPSTTPPTNTGAATSTDASAQAVTAAAMSAAATGGTVAPGDAGVARAADLPSSPADDLAAPAAGAKPSGAGAPNGPSVPALAISFARPVASASVKTAAAAPAATTLANVGAADKHASGGTADSPLSGTSVDGTAGAAQLSVNATGVADATPTPPPTLKVAAGVDTPEFGQGLADRVSWMVDNNLNGAKLQVNPPQLGPIEVRIAVQGSHAQVWLTSHSAVTRDALESSSPKLREMLGAQGFGQVSVDISQRSYQERSAYSQPYDWTPSASRGSSATAVQSTASSLPRTASGAVDAYA
jgi:flagellar hook-length control protein FliK